MNPPSLIPLPSRAALSDDQVLRHADAFNERMQQRRTVREFSDRPIAREAIEACLRAAGSAPNGANLQPWYFVRSRIWR